MASRDAGDNIGLAWSLLERAMSVYWNADYSEMLRLAEEARRLFADQGDRIGISNALLIEARATHFLGRSGATDMLGEALDIFRQADARPAIAWTLYDLAEMLAAAASPSTDPTFREAMAEFHAVGHRFGTAVGYGSWGWWARQTGQLGLSAERFQKCLSEALEIGEEGAAVWMFESIAGLAAEVGLLDEAATLFGAADRWRKELLGPMPAWDLPRYQSDLDGLRARSQPESFNAHWNRGAALSWEESVAAARAITNQVTGAVGIRA
jgi:hypothetical protein